MRYCSRKRYLFLLVFAILLAFLNRLSSWENAIEEQLQGKIVGQQQQQQTQEPPGDDDAVAQQRPIKWFLHFHKAAGTSFTDLAWANDEIVRHAKHDITAPPDRHGHLELDAHGKLRWNDLVWPNRNETHIRSCLAPIPTDNELNLIQSQRLAESITTLQEKKISFVSTEHWFPSHQVLSKQQQQNDDKLQLILIMRDPIERLISSYFFHGTGGARCPGGRPKCSFSEWWQAESNMHVQMLNGVPFGPLKVGVACARKMFTSLQLTQEHYDYALRSLQMFHVVLTLDSVIHKPTQFACVLRNGMGWNITSLPKKNARKNKNTNSIDAAHIEKAKEGNVWDIQLYQQAQKMEESLFQKLGCNDDDNVSKQ